MMICCNVRKIFNSFHSKITSSGHNAPRSMYQKVSMILVLCLGGYVLLNTHQPTSSIVLRNVQGLIYPGLRLVRKLSLPIVKCFPRLSALYDETCLIENPYFYTSGMECWPCENVCSVINSTSINHHNMFQSGVPYVVKTNQREILFEHLKLMYETNSSVFENDAPIVRNSKYTNVAELFRESSLNDKEDEHVVWRLNRMLPARLVRKLFPRPSLVPERAGQSVERYVFIDGPKASRYSLPPRFECSYVFLIQGSGDRTIVLKPSWECQEQCKPVSIVMKPSYVLWYNWWYWRPLSFPVENSTSTSISYINSYC